MLRLCLTRVCLLIYNFFSLCLAYSKKKGEEDKRDHVAKHTPLGLVEDVTPVLLVRSTSSQITHTKSVYV
jgi:hypothetical protein